MFKSLKNRRTDRGDENNGGISEKKNLYERTKNYVNSFCNCNNSTNSSLTNKNHDVAFIIMVLLRIGYDCDNLRRRATRSD
jgi:uncharacterized protein YceH (UPF0502 family)